jgi:hypothetical protein
MMAADVEESAQPAVRPAHGDDGLAGKLGGKEIARPRHLVNASDRLPVGRKDAFKFKPLHGGIEIPGRGDCVRLRKRSGVIVELED